MDGRCELVQRADLATEEDDLNYVREAVSALPREPMKELLRCGVCIRCIFRLFCLHEQILRRPFLSTSIFHTTLHELAEFNEDGADGNARQPKDSSEIESVQEFEEFKVCRVCFGILQYAYRDDQGILVQKNHAHDFSVTIGDYIKQEGHQIDSFSLEVSLPQLVVENEQAVWLFIRKKYGSESWFPETFPSERISLKDFLKMSLANLLENRLGVKSSESSFRVRLAYTFSNASARNNQIHDSNGFHKRRKTDGLKKLQKDERYQVPKDSSVVTEDDVIGMNSFPLEEVNECCSLILNCCRSSIYVGGRYLKYSRNVSQSRWIIDDERMGEASVEEIVGGNILPICRGDSYKFHAAGREDIDVRMLGTGRPFLVEIQNARQIPSDTLIKEMERKINSLENKFVRVKHLKFLGNQGWELMREGEAEKQKQYAALAWISRPLTNDDQQKLSSVKDMQILQNTPIRVLHRRSPLERQKTIHWMRVEAIAGNSQYFLLHLCTQAGTYIKEFVHGDLGRTHPSLGSILGCRAEILQLDVTDVKMDCFNE